MRVAGWTLDDWIVGEDVIWFPTQLAAEKHRNEKLRGTGRPGRSANSGCAWKLAEKFEDDAACCFQFLLLLSVPVTVRHAALLTGNLQDRRT
ncbi:hypothetical protein NDU88_011099 [Pleurodeles waltl]|uniref:Uncharacterized protein n=1 Tax=Pleurodeles waltl TaxID=8319 RepID=A0AAV7Q249_PLEWA|nr:hypothetical protein NDU88_011099 [Pleurodeles waltl]